MSKDLDHLRPKPQLQFHVASGRLSVGFRDKELGSIPLTTDNLYSLTGSIDHGLLSQGLSLRISERDLLNPVGFETLLQAVMLNMIHCTFPRMHKMGPMRKNLALQSLDWETNYIRNTEIINQANHLGVLKDKLAGLPMVIAAPGPSLDLDFLREHRGSIVLLSVGRAARNLIEAGIEPDFIYIQDINHFAWDNAFDFLGDRVLSSTLIANPVGKIFKYRRNFKRIIKAWNFYPFERDLMPRIDEIAPSSTTGAYSVARLLGCDPVILMGNDNGVPEPPRKASSILESMTNIPHTFQGREVVLEPFKYTHTMYLRFADEFSVLTRNEYVSGSQWLKVRSLADHQQAGKTTFDNSATGLCRFNSVIADMDGLGPLQPISLPPLPLYETDYDSTRLLLHKQKGYAFIHRQLEKGIMPASALKRPYSCLLQGTEMASRDIAEANEADIALALENARTIMGHIEKALSRVRRAA